MTGYTNPFRAPGASAPARKPGLSAATKAAIDAGRLTSEAALELGEKPVSAATVAKSIARAVKNAVTPLQAEIDRLKADVAKLTETLAIEQQRAVGDLRAAAAVFAPSLADLDEMHERHLERTRDVTKSTDGEMIVHQTVDRDGIVLETSRRRPEGPDFKSVRAKQQRDAGVADQLKDSDHG